MRMILLAGAALALSACGGGGETAANDANAMMADNMLMDDNMMMDGNAALNGTTALDANGSVDSTNANMMAIDAATNDADTNLANGL
ncbi:MAG TPA: hypothetical protein VF605_06695 [Allosphingosinicella sp.]|jgi:hypothetical protein